MQRKTTDLIITPKLSHRVGLQKSYLYSNQFGCPEALEKVVNHATMVADALSDYYDIFVC